MLVVDRNVLDSLLKFLSRQEEEASFAFSELIGTPLVLTILAYWVKDNAVLS